MPTQTSIEHAYVKIHYLATVNLTYEKESKYIQRGRIRKLQSNIPTKYNHQKELRFLCGYAATPKFKCASPPYIKGMKNVPLA